MTSRNAQWLVNSSERRESLADNRPVACSHRELPRRRRSLEDVSSEPRGENTCNKDSSLRPLSGRDTREVLRFHHYAIEDGRYHPSRGSSASVATPGILSSWPTRPTRHRHGANVVRIPPLVFILLLRAAVIASSYTLVARLEGNQIGNIRPGIINTTDCRGARP